MSSARSAAEAYLASFSRAMARSQIVATSSGTAGLRCRTGTRSSSISCRRIVRGLEPSIGGEPVSISYITAPRE